MSLAELWETVHNRLSSGKPVQRITLPELTNEQLSELADLLGLDRYPAAKSTIKIADLEAAISSSTGKALAVYVTNLLGPLDNHLERRNLATAERAELWHWLEIETPPELSEWAHAVRTAGIINGSASHTRTILATTLNILENLPADGIPLPKFADTMLANPHGLDDGTRLSNLVLRALATIYGIPFPQDAESRRFLWQQAGITDDELSPTVLVAGLRLTAGLVGNLTTLCADNSQACSLTLAQIRRMPTVTDAPPDIWIVENPSILALALTTYGKDCPPLICTSGWPNSAGILLLRTLAQSTLHYHGDFDGEGLRITTYITTKTPATPWLMTTNDYLSALTNTPTGPPPGRVTPAPWDPNLSPALLHHNTTIPEERLAPTLFAAIDQARGF